jgi:hypothetical protein
LTARAIAPLNCCSLFEFRVFPGGVPVYSEQPFVFNDANAWPKIQKFDFGEKIQDVRASAGINSNNRFVQNGKESEPRIIGGEVNFP